MQVSLRVQLLTSLCSIALVSTALMLVMQHRSISTDLETVARQRFENSCVTVERLVARHLGLLRTRYEEIAARPYVRAIVESGDGPSIFDIASGLSANHDLTRLAFIGNDGRVIGGAGDEALDPYALDTVNTRLIVFEGVPFAVVSVPLLGGALEFGRLVAVEPLPEAELASWTVIAGAKVFIDSQAGGSPDRRRKMLRDLGTLQLYAETPRISEADRAAILNSRRNLFFAGALSLVVAFAAGLVISRGLVRPIQELGRAAERIGSGDLTVTLQSERGDEIGVVARAFEQMTTDLRNVIVGVSDSADQVESVARQISTLTEGVAAATVDQALGTSEASATIDRINEEVEEVARAAERSALTLAESTQGSTSAVHGLVAVSNALTRNARELCDQTDELSSSMTTSTDQIAQSSKVLAANSAASSAAVEEVADSTTKVIQYAKQSRELSSRVVEIAEQGRQRVQATAEGMSAIQRESKLVEQSISSLGERIGEISSVVNLIESIADRAKLLALNGSIVAAQAGEKGRAFSVVAEEMRDLADLVFSETGKIVEVIHAIKNEASDALLATGRSSQSVDAGVDLASEAGKSLDSITDVARENRRHMDNVLAATKLQSQASERALELMTGTHAELEQIHIACGEQANIAESVNQRSVALVETAGEVLKATEAQEDQSSRIIEIVETVRDEVERNSSALLEQAAAFAEANQQMESVNERTAANRESVTQVDAAVRELLLQAECLRGEIQRIRC